MKTNKNSVEVLDSSDRMEDILNWTLFANEQDNRLWGYNEEINWTPGDPIYDWGMGGYVRLMAEILNDHENFDLWSRCKDCEVYWDDDDPCFVCGVLVPVKKRVDENSAWGCGCIMCIAVAADMRRELGRELDRQILFGQGQPPIPDDVRRAVEQAEAQGRDRIRVVRTELDRSRLRANDVAPDEPITVNYETWQRGRNGWECVTPRPEPARGEPVVWRDEIANWEATIDFTLPPTEAQRLWGILTAEPEIVEESRQVQGNPPELPVRDNPRPWVTGSINQQRRRRD